MHTNDRRLIEDLIPIREISEEASREKSLRHGNISTLHLWWSRKPLSASRAAIYGALIPAPTSQEEREVHTNFMQKLCRWGVPQSVMKEAQQRILHANNGQPPRVLDMFAGGGSIPLEALRLGCEAYAVDLNPVAHIIELCTLVYPQTYGTSLIADVKKWGEWVINQAKEQLAEFYPKLENETGTTQSEDVSQLSLTDEPASVRTSNALTPVAYLWTRTVTCPNPTCNAVVPLLRQTWLRKKANGYVALRMTPDHSTKQVRFEVVKSPTVEGLDFDPEVGNSRGNTVCPFCGAPVESEHVKQEGRGKRIGKQLMAVVLTKAGVAGKTYMSSSDFQHAIVDDNLIMRRIESITSKWNDISLFEEKINDQETRWFSPPDYGFTRFVDLFTPRQLLSLLTFTALVRQAYQLMLEEGTEVERATAITTYLGLMVDRLADYNSTICHWHNTRELIGDTYARQALPMMWDFAEVNPFGDASGNLTGALERILKAFEVLVDCGRPALVSRHSAGQLSYEDRTFDVIVTDPPYYDNVTYADLSDFFYVWLKRSIGFLYPEHFNTLLTPKKQEAIMAAYRHKKSKAVAKTAYETMIAQAFSEAHRVLKPGAPMICVYAHKTTLGWSTLIEALRHAGFVIVEAWPLDTEMKARSVAQGTAALASSIFLVARKRENEKTGDYVSQVRPQLASIIDERLTTLLDAGVTGADLIIATIGAGLRAYTQYARVEMPNGDELDAATYLAEVEREVADHVLQRLLQAAESEGGSIGAQVAAVDTMTRFYVTARFFYDESAAPFDDMNLLARGMGVELSGPHGLSQGKKGLVNKVKDTIQLRDYCERGNDESLGLPTQSGNPSPLIDILHRLLWLQENNPYEVADFLIKAHPHTDQLRMVAQALSGHALAPVGNNGASKQQRSEEQKAIDRLLAGWRGVFSEMSHETLWGYR